MEKNRLEAFSDGVLAIVITIMVLEIKVPHGAEWSELNELIPKFLSYILSFMYIGIYWGNHHHLLHTARRVYSDIMLANLNLLFWLSLIPFATGWMGENHFEKNPVILYAVSLLLCGISYNILQMTIERHHKGDNKLAEIFAGQTRKGLISLVAYSSAIAFAFYNTLISGVLFFAVAIMLLIPDKNIERFFNDK